MDIYELTIIFFVSLVLFNIAFYMLYRIMKENFDESISFIRTYSEKQIEDYRAMYLRMIEAKSDIEDFDVEDDEDDDDDEDDGGGRFHQKNRITDSLN